MTGRFQVEIKSVVVSQNSDNSRPVICLEYEILDEPYCGSLIPDRLVITPNALWKVKRILTITNSSLLDRSEFTDEDIAGDLQGKRISVHIEGTVNPATETIKYQISSWQQLKAE